MTGAFEALATEHPRISQARTDLSEAEATAPQGAVASARSDAILLSSP